MKSNRLASTLMLSLLVGPMALLAPKAMAGENMICNNTVCNGANLKCSFKKDSYHYPKDQCTSGAYGTCSNFANGSCVRVVTWPNSSCGGDGTTPVSDSTSTVNYCGLA